MAFRTLPIFHTETNSSYFSDVDIARAHLLCTLFSTGIEKVRGGTGPITGKNGPSFGVALGSGICSFKREIKPYHSYDMSSRILSWDEKWIYIITQFVSKDATREQVSTLYLGQNNRQTSSDIPATNREGAVFATALSKCVFKEGRKTISPEAMLRRSELLPDLSDIPADLAEIKCSVENEWPTERVELQRRGGMEMARQFMCTETQDALAKEFASTSYILGRHSGGLGLLGTFVAWAKSAGVTDIQLL